MLMLLYSAASFAGAFLLFAVQPMAAKAVLPVLGGTPAVWNGSMLFFQAALLLAYLYAHLGARHLGVRAQALLHIILMAAVLALAFPIGYALPWELDPLAHPMIWLSGMLLLSVGGPYFIVSATAPLLQYWLSSTTHSRAGNPYILYAASNTGSLAGLLCFPLLVEPVLPLGAQGEFYGYGFALLAALMALAAMRLLREGTKADADAPAPREAGPPPGRREKLHWVALSFIPASLLYGVTTHITTDVASMPLLWVIPLALYLLSFVFVFAHTPIGYRLALKLHLPVLMVFLPFIILMPILKAGFLALHLLVFFLCILVCHGLLAERKPHPAHLTGFYLWMAFGGVLGGAFNTLLAPHLFNGVAEYPLMLLMTLAIRGNPAQLRDLAKRHRGEIKKSALYFAVIAAAVLAGYYLAHRYVTPLPLSYFSVFLVFATTHLSIGMARTFWKSREKFLPTAAALGLFLLTAPVVKQNIDRTDVIFQDRNFFGVSRVIEAREYSARIFQHGTTLHGVQSLDPEKRLHPTSYYAPLKEVFAALPGRAAEKAVAVMGMGAGTAACYGKKGQALDMFEIDPLVARIATDKTLFTYLSDCPPEINIVMGDARISLSKAGNKRYGIMVMDAFSSDAIPVHLLTREAVEMYEQKLADGGAIAFNVTNRHVDLKPVLAAVAQSLGIPLRRKLFSRGDINALTFASEWAVITRDPDALRALDGLGWETLAASGDPAYLWRDDFSNLVKALKF